MTRVGRPLVDPMLRKTPRSVKLPEWLWRWIDAQPGTNRALLIEEAIRSRFHPRRPADER